MQKKLDFRTEESSPTLKESDNIQEEKSKDDFQKNLFLPNLDDGENYIISMCPMNSSGDSYHILSYIILALSHGKTVPPVQLTYDSSQTEITAESSMNNYTAVQRTLNFALMLSLRTHFNEPLYLNPGINAETQETYKSPTYQQNARQHNLRWTLPQFGTHFVDQKALTTLIVQHFLQHGRKDTIGRLQSGFSNYDKSNNDLEAVIRHATDEYTRIAGKLAVNEPLVIIHARYASTANDTQNIEGDALKVKDYLTHNGYKTWFIIADGRSQQTSFKTLKNEDRTDPFPHYLTKKKEHDYGKFYHLRLLLKLIERPNVKVIGNTSGTLDLAAFLGHDVYNLHVWDASMNYQCARILMQSAFLTLDLIKSDFLDGLQRDNNVWGFGVWLQDSSKKPAIESKDRTAAFATPGQSGYKDLFSVQVLPRPGIAEASTRLPAFDSIQNAIAPN